MTISWLKISKYTVISAVVIWLIMLVVKISISTSKFAPVNFAYFRIAEVEIKSIQNTNSLIISNHQQLTVLRKLFLGLKKIEKNSSLSTKPTYHLMLSFEDHDSIEVLLYQNKQKGGTIEFCNQIYSGDELWNYVDSTFRITKAP